MAHREESDPRKPQVLSIGEDVLHEEIRVATVIQVSTQVALLFRIHHVNVLRILEVISKGFSSLESSESGDNVIEWRP